MSNGQVFTIGSASALDTLLQRTKDANIPVVLDFTATWCGPCKAVAPVFESLAKEHPKTAFLKVDIDEQKDLAQRYGIASVPTFIGIAKDGNTKDTVKGADVQKLKTLVKDVSA